jgi:hypothetical protein
MKKAAAYFFQRNVVDQACPAQPGSAEYSRFSLGMLQRL